MASVENIRKDREKEWEKLEKILLTIDGGALALTISVFADRSTSLSHPLLLKLSWISFFISILSLLLTYVFYEWFAVDLARKVQRRTYDPIDEAKARNGLIWFAVLSLNYVALGFGVLGMSLLVFFGLYSL